MRPHARPRGHPRPPRRPNATTMTAATGPRRPHETAGTALRGSQVLPRAATERLQYQNTAKLPHI
eukprot:6643270-Pyramimonas_sp.AAC.1